MKNGLLKDYFEFALSNRGEVIEKLLFPQLLLHEDPLLSARLSDSVANLNYNELILLVEYAYMNGEREIIDNCFNRIIFFKTFGIFRIDPMGKS